MAAFPQRSGRHSRLRETRAFPRGLWLRVRTHLRRNRGCAHDKDERKLSQTHITAVILSLLMWGGRKVPQEDVGKEMCCSAEEPGPRPGPGHRDSLSATHWGDTRMGLWLMADPSSAALLKAFFFFLTALPAHNWGFFYPHLSSISLHLHPTAMMNFFSYLYGSNTLTLPKKILRAEF